MKVRQGCRALLVGPAVPLRSRSWPRRQPVGRRQTGWIAGGKT